MRGPVIDDVDFDRTVRSVEHRIFGTGRPTVEIGHYQVRATVGEGAMGRVYLAHDPRLQRDVALKIIRLDRVGSVHEAAGARLLNEARAIARLSHPNIVEIFDTGRHERAVYIAMQLVSGVTIAEWARESDRSTEEITRAFVQAGRGLVAAHDAGIVHRDFKPSNVLVGDDGVVRVVDFGLASSIGQPQDTPAGTLNYMAPEQLAGEAIDGRADQFAFCTSLAQILGSRSIPSRVTRALQRGREADPDQRFNDMSALLRALSPRRRNFIPLILIGGLVCAAALAIALRPNEDREASCRELAEPVLSAWSQANAQLGAATKTSAARAAWPRASATLGEWVGTWADEVGATCTAISESAPGADARLRCLEAQREVWDRLMSRVQGPETDALDKALETALALPEPSGCREASTMIEPVADPAIAQRVAELRGRTEEVKVLNAAGDPIEARRLASRLLEDARALGYPPLEAELWFEQGRASAAASEFLAADGELSVAYHAASSMGHSSVACSAAASLAVLHGWNLEDRHRGEEWLRHAEVACPRDNARTVQRTKGVLALERGDLEEARALLEPLIVSARENQDEYWLLVALQSLATLRHEQEDFEGVVELLTQAVELSTRLLGADHPRSLRYRGQLGSATHRAGRSAAAIEQLKPVLAETEALFGDESPELVNVLNALGLASRALERFEDAENYGERALQIVRTTQGENSPIVAAHLNNLSLVAQAKGDLQRAEQRLLEAAEVIVSAHGIEDRELAVVYSNLGNIASDQGAFDRAHRYFAQGVSVAEAELGREHMLVASLLHNAGAAYVRDDDPVSAMPLFLRAHQIKSAHHPGGHPTVVRTAHGLGQTLFDIGQMEQARDVLEQALRQHEQNPSQPVVGSKIRFQLARTLWALGQRQRARTLASAAEREFAARPESKDDLDEVAAWRRTHR